ncbi:hypothetical protein [Vitiosangium sp. GDMCC 1.1324]|uniref:tetratricopeptide repeat protein n=1 Tax=Vitiosangium sp. (strain GDMCC 1.1324) TaxID=2138576 RepID=UPI000D397805|nr:hypothetical protein [Vitiosangium sp. GDMCC 1.1324]PTL81608.1 hypothetical protein DAT35_21890 [Vitiosangium sp. GDMCC 1.1324]
MTATYASLREQALEALQAQDARKAYSTFRWALQYPGAPELEDPEQWKEAWELFARIAASLAGEELADIIRKAAHAPKDAQALYYLGYQLIEQKLYGIAATPLARAHRLVPRQEPLLLEFITALEGAGHHEAAVETLHTLPRLVESSFMCRYRLAYNAIMSGDLEEPRRLVLGLQALLARIPPEDPNAPHYPAMAERIRQMLARAEALQAVTPLDSSDLRGWHFVVTGGVLLHLSAHGWEAGMNGRYAFVQDSVSTCLEGIRRVEAVLSQTGRLLPRVFILPERYSAILGHATARVLGVPAEPWPEQGSDAPGLVVAYDLMNLEPPLLKTLQPHRPGQVLWSHATQWTEELPFTADLTTFMYQMNFAPWGERLRLDPDARPGERTPPAEGPVEELAQGVISAKLSEDALEDLPVLSRLVAAMGSLKDAAAGGLFVQQGLRRRHLSDSPVKSGRFG